MAEVVHVMAADARVATDAATANPPRPVASVYPPSPSLSSSPPVSAPALAMFRALLRDMVSVDIFMHFGLCAASYTPCTDNYWRGHLLTSSLLFTRDP